MNNPPKFPWSRPQDYSSHKEPAHGTYKRVRRRLAAAPAVTSPSTARSMTAITRKVFPSSGTQATI